MNEVLSPSSSMDESDDAEIYVPPKPRVTEAMEGRSQALKAAEDQGRVIISLDRYLPLGCLHVKLSETYHWIDSPEWLEATEFLPHLAEAVSLNNALTTLWRLHWLKIFRSSPSSDRGQELWRLYILPDDEARSIVDRTKASLRKQLDEVLIALDVSISAWMGQNICSDQSRFDRWPAADFTSLYYLFNTLPSPDPSLQGVQDRYSRSALQELMGNDGLSGLLSLLHPYQKRSVAEMLRRESSPVLQLDPRLEERSAPDGMKYYYNARDRLFLRQARQYDSVRGGILAETMGLGKTIICLALILATKGHTSKVPAPYSACKLVSDTVPSLRDMTAATLASSTVPWRRRFEHIKDTEGLDMTECVKSMEQQEPQYEIPPTVVRSHRYSTFSSPSEYIRLSSTTLVVVPKNLVHQWKAELSKHVRDGALRVLVLEDRHKPVPQATELAKYDLVLFSRPRFEIEGKSTEEFYESPLQKLLWLRMIIDEGHGISSGNSNAAVVAEKLVRAERRWVVSGTPAKDLMGIEVDLNAMTNSTDTEFRHAALEKRKAFNVYQEESSGALKALGQLTSRYLKAQPWAASNSPYGNADGAKWEDYVYRHESLTVKTFSGFTTCLRRTLENLVVKTRPEDVERDIELPPLTHSIIRLNPSFFDKITANLFVLLILSNAVTSERQDMDYLFHRNSQVHLHRLISSLRQSGFYWTSIDETDLSKSVDVTRKYLVKDGIICSDEDRALIDETVSAASVAMESATWRAITQTSEMGITLEHWPNAAVEAWSFASSTDPMAMGLTHAYEAQKYINQRLTTEDPIEGFAASAHAIKVALAEHSVTDKKQGVFVPKVLTDQKTIIEAAPRQIAPTEPSASRPLDPATPIDEPQTQLGHEKIAPVTPKKTPVKRKSIAGPAEEPPSNQKKRRIDAAANGVELSPDSELGQTIITGTTSSKFTYLLERILDLHQEEKVLIFYDADFIAYNLATALDLFHIKYLIYATTMSNERRGKHLVLFNDDDSQRVMLMDIKQAAHGLNVSTASRVFFVNPVCRPNIEAQAIKRAHRIGQTKPVYVETLILEGTVEEAMQERATRMTNHEHLQAKTLEDDLGVARIIQSARVLPFEPEELEPENQMAKLAVPQQLFGRPGRGGESKLEKEVFGTEENDIGTSAGSKKRRVGNGKDGKARQSKGAGTSRGKGKKSVTIKEEPIDDPIPWNSAGDGGWAPGLSQNSIFGGP